MKKMNIEDLKMDEEEMEHTGLDLGEEDTKMDLREMLTNQQEQLHRPSGSISSQWAVEIFTSDLYFIFN